MIDPPTLQFAIAAFDTSAEVQKALHALSAGVRHSTMSATWGLDRVLADKTGEIRQTLRTLVFPGNVTPSPAPQVRWLIAWLAGSRSERPRWIPHSAGGLSLAMQPISKKRWRMAKSCSGSSFSMRR